MEKPKSLPIERWSPGVNLSASNRETKQTSPKATENFRNFYKVTTSTMARIEAKLDILLGMKHGNT